MNLSAVYVRTEKARQEIAQRSQAIPSRARSLLMLIDDKLNGAQLLEKFASYQNSTEFLELLAEQGYIEAQAGAEAAVAATPVVAAAPSAAPAAPVSPSIHEAKRHVIRTLHDVLGPEADFLTEKIEAALTGGELRVHAAKYRDMLIEMGKPKKAAAYWETFEQLLPED